MVSYNGTITVTDPRLARLRLAQGPTNPAGTPALPRAQWGTTGQLLEAFFSSCVCSTAARCFSSHEAVATPTGKNTWELHAPDGPKMNVVKELAEAGVDARLTLSSAGVPDMRVRLRAGVTTVTLRRYEWVGPDSDSVVTAISRQHARQLLMACTGEPATAVLRALESPPSAAAHPHSRIEFIVDAAGSGSLAELMDALEVAIGPEVLLTKLEGEHVCFSVPADPPESATTIVEMVHCLDLAGTARFNEHHWAFGPKGLAHTTMTPLAWYPQDPDDQIESIPISRAARTAFVALLAGRDHPDLPDALAALTDALR